MKVACIGDDLFIAGFELIGIEGFRALNENEIKEKLKFLIKTGEYGLIILPERYVKPTEEIRSKVVKEGAIVPMFAFMPDHTGIKGERVEELKRLLSIAIGAKLKL